MGEWRKMETKKARHCIVNLLTLIMHRKHFVSHKHNHGYNNDCNISHTKVMKCYSTSYSVIKSRLDWSTIIFKHPALLDGGWLSGESQRLKLWSEHPSSSIFTWYNMWKLNVCFSYNKCQPKLDYIFGSIWVKMQMFDTNTFFKITRGETFRQQNIDYNMW